jgi:hypothetical protein
MLHKAVYYRNLKNRANGFGTGIDLFTQQINIADPLGARWDSRLPLALTNKVFPIIIVFGLFWIDAIKTDVFASLLSRCK